MNQELTNSVQIVLEWEEPRVTKPGQILSYHLMWKEDDGSDNNDFNSFRNVNLNGETFTTTSATITELYYYDSEDFYIDEQLKVPVETGHSYKF